MHTRKPWIRSITDGQEGGGTDGAAAEDEGTPEGPKSDDATEDDPDDSDGDDFDRDRALRKISKANSEAKSQRERAKAAEAKLAAAGDAESRAEKAERRVMQLEAAVKFGLPSTLASRLQGNTAEEIAADAEELLQLFGSKKAPSDRPKPKLKSGSLNESDDEGSAKSIVDRALNR